MIACHSRALEELLVYLSVINIRTTDRVVFDMMTLCEDPICVDELAKVTVCGSAG